MIYYFYTNGDTCKIIAMTEAARKNFTAIEERIEEILPPPITVNILYDLHKKPVVAL